MKKNLNVAIYMGSWTPNIGNAFFDFGAKAIIQKALPEANIFHIGGAVRWMFGQALNNILNISFGNINLNINKKISPLDNAIEIGGIIDVDLIVCPGMCLSEDFIKYNGPTFIQAAKNQIPILFLGAGSALYSQQETNSYINFLKQLHRFFIISRDEVTYNLFKNYTENILSGIDCAFFLSDYYSPPKLKLPKYNIENFDSLNVIPKIDHHDNIVFYTHHDCFGPMPGKYVNYPNSLISDIPEDYLTLYSQVNETHSDRVHACIATLSYGNKAKFYGSTKRSELFNRVGVKDIENSITSIDQNLLTQLKQEQIEHTVKAIRYICNE